MMSQQMRLALPMFFLVPFMVAHAQWNSDPALNNAIVRAGNNQNAPRLISDGQGGAIICWYDERAQQNSFDVYAQRIDKNGFIRWTVNGIAVSAAAESQLQPDIVSDDVGGAIIAWTDTRNGDNDIYAQRIDADGNALWTQDGVPVALGILNQADPKLVSDGKHGAIVTWNAGDGGFPPKSKIYTQRIDANGTLRWGADVLVSGSLRFSNAPTIASDGSGGAFIAYAYLPRPHYDVYAQRVDSSGALQWQNNGVAIATGSTTQDSPALVADGAGNAFLAYSDWGSGSTALLYIVVLKKDGSVVASMRATSTSGGQIGHQLSKIGTGLLGIVWEDGRAGGKKRSYAQIIDSAGTKLWAANGVEVSNRSGDQVGPYIISDGNDGVIVAWGDQTGGTIQTDIYAQRLSGNGSLLWSSAGVPVCTADKIQQFPRMISDGQNGAIMAWEDYRPSYANVDIYASRILGDGTFPIGPPILTFSSKTVALGTVALGHSSTKNITLTNTGGIPVTIASVTSSDPQFSLTPGSNTIAPGASFDDTVRFSPTVLGPVSADLTLTSNAPTSPTIVPLSGTGVAEVTMTIDLENISFGDVIVGASRDTTVTITNTGNDTLRISSFTSGDPRFTLETPIAAIAPLSDKTFTLRFAPDAAGPLSTIFTVASNAISSPDAINVDGTGVVDPAISFTPSQLSFGSVGVGSKKDLVLTINNTGSLKLTVTAITSSNADFSALVGQFEVPGGSSFNDTIRFMPSVTGSLSGILTIASNAATSPDTVLVQGTGTDVSAVRQLQVFPGAFTLFQNYPNPFNPSTTIGYDLKTSAPVRVTVLNSLGQVAATLVDETQHPGVHTVRWTPAGSTPGVYFYVLRVGTLEAYGTMVLMK